MNIRVAQHPKAEKQRKPVFLYGRMALGKVLADFPPEILGTNTA